MERTKFIYWKLFISTFYISAFTFGGGYVIIPLMKKKFVEDLNWIEEKEMFDLIAISQSSPGAIAVNASILIGYRIAGFLGAIVTILGTILPPFIILSVVSFFYAEFKDNQIINLMLRGMQVGVAAIIINVVINMAGGIIKEKNMISIFIMVGAFIANYFFKINILIIILTCGFIGIVSIYLNKKKERGINKI